MDTAPGSHDATPHSDNTVPAQAAPFAPTAGQAATDFGWRRKHTFAVIYGAVATVAVLGVGTALGISGAVSALVPEHPSSSLSNSALGGAGGLGQPGSGSTGSGGSGNSGSGGGFGYGNGSNGFSFGGGAGGNGAGGNGYGGSGDGGDGGSGSGSDGDGTSSLPSASAQQEVGVVDIVSDLQYDSAESAGTGLVLTSSGEILTNNHVVEDSTSVKVTVISTGKTYTAKVVGTDATDDIAVLKLSGASGLQTANLNTSGKVSVGDSVTGVGNAGGTGGTPSASAGKVTGLNQSITTEAEESAKSEALKGLIETNADIQAGDSGGPLFDSNNTVVGIDTAASSGGTTPQGYAIPINTALSLANKIISGQASSTIIIGLPAFLGVEVADSENGATISQVIDGTPAESAGIAAGDTITAVNGTTVSSASDLSSLLQSFKPGQTVQISWVDQTGASGSANVTLTSGPAA